MSEKAPAYARDTVSIDRYPLRNGGKLEIDGRMWHCNLAFHRYIGLHEDEVAEIAQIWLQRDQERMARQYPAVVVASTEGDSGLADQQGGQHE